MHVPWNEGKATALNNQYFALAVAMSLWHGSLILTSHSYVNWATYLRVPILIILSIIILQVDGVNTSKEGGRHVRWKSY